MLTEAETIVVAILASWQILVPVIYSLLIDKPAKFTDRLLYIFASVALSLLAMIFLYTIVSRLGLIDFLVGIDSRYANYVIVLIVFICPLLIALGYYALKHYKPESNA